MASPSQSPPSTVQQELRLPTDHGQKLNGFSGIASFLWSIADLLRGSYRQSDYGKVILPMTVLRRLTACCATRSRRCSRRRRR
jgi:type I restriction-modification system DNA methylase subunit